MVIFETKWYATGCGAMSQKLQLDADLALESAKKKKKVRQREAVEEQLTCGDDRQPRHRCALPEIQ